MKINAFYKHSSSKHIIKVIKIEDNIYTLNILCFGYYPDLNNPLGRLGYDWQLATIDCDALPHNEFTEITEQEVTELHNNWELEFKQKTEKILESKL